MITIQQAEKKAHEAFSRLVQTDTAVIYTDTCFHTQFILRHKRELSRSRQHVLVIKSVQIELKYKRKEEWAVKRLRAYRLRSDCFRLLAPDKEERRKLYSHRKSVYADGVFESIFRSMEHKTNVLLTGDYALAETIAGMSSTLAVIYQYAASDGRVHIALWHDYQKFPV